MNLLSVQKILQGAWDHGKQSVGRNCIVTPLLHCKTESMHWGRHSFPRVYKPCMMTDCRLENHWSSRRSKMKRETRWHYPIFLGLSDLQTPNAVFTMFWDGSSPAFIGSLLLTGFSKSVWIDSGIGLSRDIADSDMV